MKIKEFTEEEMALLRESEYILDVTPQSVYYSAEFKERFFREYQEGKKPRRIIEGMGIDTKILGQTRVNGIKRRVLRDVQLGKGFTEITSESCVKQTGRALTPEAKIRRLEHELAYTRQELEFVKKNYCRWPGGTKMIYVDIPPEKKYMIIQEMTRRDNNLLSITVLCDIAGVSRSGYYRWCAEEPKRIQREAKDRADFELVLAAYQHRGYAKGARGIYMQLLHKKPAVVMNIKKIRRLMAKYGLFCPIRKANPYRRMARALKTSNVAENLVNREFEAHGPRMILLTDISYIPYNGTFCYLSLITDAFTKQALAYVVSKSLEVDFVLETVNNLIRDHGISLHAETIVHSDQGVHYTSYKFIQILKDSNLRQSMSRRGNCWDNAPQESFFGHMKDEISLEGCETYEQGEANLLAVSKKATGLTLNYLLFYIRLCSFQSKG